MKQKMYDINPPHQEEKVIKEEKKEKKNSSFVKFLGIGIVIIIIALLGVWLFVSASVVTIDLWPTLNEFSVNTDVAFSIEEEEDTILMEPFEYTEEISKNFEAPSIDIGEKATGIIKVYNKYSSSITLVKGTRFLSSAEPTRQFHTLKKITVPSGGSVDVSVIASEPGDSYNIGPSTFSVPGLRDFSPAQLYYDVYGRSESDMTGGRQELIKRIEEDTFENTEKQMLEQARDEMIEAISERIAPDYVLLNDSLTIELLESEAVDAKVGQEVESFVYRIKIEVTGFKTHKTLLDDFARTYIKSVIPDTKEFVDNVSIDFVEIEGGAMDTETEKNINISTDVYTKIDQESIDEISRGRSKSSIARYIQEMHPDLAKPVKVSFSPIWARKSSLSPKTIDIQINY